LSGPVADLPAAAASSCCESCSNETLNCPLSRTRRVVRDPWCSAMATMAGSRETYIVVPVAQERSPPCAAPMMATWWAMRDSAKRATPNGSAYGSEGPDGLVRALSKIGPMVLPFAPEPCG